jgi:hypothetical protein
MTRPISPARAHFERVSAEQRQAESQPTARSDATAYELMLAKLAEDRRKLHELQSIERRIELKRVLLPDYAPWVEGVLASDQGVQDDVLMTVMVWRIDTGDLDGALAIAIHALRHDLAMPDQYKRTTACLIAEEFADYALRLTEGIPAEITDLLIAASDVTASLDMPDEVRAKLLKAIGYGRDQRGEKDAALGALNQALKLHDKVGVKKDIERLERELKNSAKAREGGG